MNNFRRYTISTNEVSPALRSFRRTPGVDIRISELHLVGFLIFSCVLSYPRSNLTFNPKGSTNDWQTVWKKKNYEASLP